MLTVIKNGRSYEVPLEIEAKGDQAVEAWLVSAVAQEERKSTDSDAPPATSGRRAKREG